MTLSRRFRLRYPYWNKPYFLAKAESIGPETKILIERVIEKFQYPVQSFRSCFGILRYAEKYGKLALEECCHDAILHGKCNYTYIANTISMYVKPAAEPPLDRMSSMLKPIILTRINRKSLFRPHET